MGVIVGTAAYMAPEQARGKPVDRRADVWAFGVVLFEMLSGRRAFTGDDVSDVIASVLRDNVPFERLPAGTPDAVRRLLRRCLEKDRAKRLDSMSAARLDIDEALSDPVTFRPRSQLPVDLPRRPPSVSQFPDSGAAPPASSPPPPASGARLQSSGAQPVPPVAQLPGSGASPQPQPSAFKRSPPWLAVWLVALVAWLAIARPWQRSERSDSLRIAVDPGFDGTVVADLMPEIVFSPDGRTIAFSGRGRDGGRSHLYLRRLDQLEATLLQGTDDASDPFFSPDGQWIGFFMPGKLCKMSITGGAITTLADVQIPRGATWGDDGVITFAPQAIPNRPLQRIAASGGAVAAFGAMPAGHITQRWPQAIPGSRTLLYTGSPSVDTFEDACLVAQEPGGAPKIIQCGGYAWRYVPGHILYVHGGTLFAAPFDLTRLAIAGPGVAAVPQVRSAVVSGAAQFAVSRDGTLAYVPGHADGALNPVQVIGRDGKGSPLTGVPVAWQTIAFSPDGRHLALDSTAPNAGIWLYDVDRAAPTRLTLSGGDSTPVWSPDGRRVAYSSTAGGPANLWTIAADGSGERQRLADSPDLQVPDSWSPDGTTLVFSQSSARNQFDLWLLPLQKDGDGIKGGTPKPFVATPANEGFATFSPDGKWIAYTSDESGTYQVYVRASNGTGGRYQVSAANGVWPQWSRAKPELIFGALDNTVMFATWSAANGVFRSSRPEPWTAARYAARSTFAPFAIHPDGARLAMSIDPASSPAASLVLVTDFVAGLASKNRRAP